MQHDPPNTQRGTPAETLGVLVTSSRHVDALCELTRAACQKGKRVRIHFLGEALTLIDRPEIQRLHPAVMIIVCTEGTCPSLEEGRCRDRRSLTTVPPQQVVDLVKQCHRTIVL